MSRSLNKIEGVMPAGLAFPEPKRLGADPDPNSGFRRVLAASAGSEIIGGQHGVRSSIGITLCADTAKILLAEQARNS